MRGRGIVCATGGEEAECCGDSTGGRCGCEEGGLREWEEKSVVKSFHERDHESRMIEPL